MVIDFAQLVHFVSREFPLLPHLISVNILVEQLLPVLFDEPLGVFDVCSVFVKVASDTLRVNISLVPAQGITGSRTEVSALQLVARESCSAGDAGINPSPFLLSRPFIASAGLTESIQPMNQIFTGDFHCFPFDFTMKFSAILSAFSSIPPMYPRAGSTTSHS